MGSLAKALEVGQGKSDAEKLAAISAKVAGVVSDVGQVSYDYEQLRKTPGLDAEDIATLDASFIATVAEAKVAYDALPRRVDLTDPKLSGDWADEFVAGLGFTKN